MKKRSYYFSFSVVLIVMFVALISLSGCYCKSTEISACSNMEIADPMAENCGDFLDVDLSKLEQKAYQEYQAKNYKESAGHYLKALQYNIDDSNSIYNLACCYGLLGEKELAAKYLERAIRAGFEDIEHIMRDTDFDKVRDSDEFKAIVDNAAGKIKEKNEILGKIGYVKAPLLQKYRLHLPENYDSSRTYPLIIGLHGFGSNADNFIGLWKGFGNSEVIYVTLDAPFEVPERTGKSYSWRTWIPGIEGFFPGCGEISEQLIVATTREMRKEFNVQGTYLLGFSQGSWFAYSTGIKNHGDISGVICFGGGLDEEIDDEMLEAAKTLRVFIGHGTEDNVVEYEMGTAAKNRLEKNGYDVTFVDFEGGHYINENALKKAIEWINEQ